MMLNPFTRSRCSNTTRLVRGSEAAFSNIANALIMQLSIFLTPQDNNFFFSIWIHFVYYIPLLAMHAHLFLCLFSALKLSQKSSSQYSVQLPINKLFITSDKNTRGRLCPHSHSLAPPSAVKPSHPHFLPDHSNTFSVRPTKNTAPNLYPFFLQFLLSLAENLVLPTSTT